MTSQIFTVIIDQVANDSVYGAHIKGRSMQIHPLFSVKKAAEALGVEKGFLRSQLEQGSIRGEKRRVGERDKWFIYNGEVRDLRDTKRLHELLEKAGRISTEDMGDFFEEDEEVALAPVLDASGDLTATNLTAKTFESVEAIEVSREALETLQSSVAEPGESSDSLDFTELFFESRVVDDLSVDDLFFERVEIVDPADVEFMEEQDVVNIDDTVSGSSRITVETMLQKLTAEFAHQLAEERSRIADLTRQLEIKDESLRLLPDLERKLEEEQSVRLAHAEEVTLLKAQITSLEAERIKANKPWWKKLLG